MHNRARMVSASFLTKHLQIDYRRGEAHYLRYLTDGDWAQNNAGWQWAAGLWMRRPAVLPSLQPDDPGEEVRSRTGPTCGAGSRSSPTLPARFIHRPWEAPASVLAESGVVAR